VDRRRRSEGLGCRFWLGNETWLRLGCRLYRRLRLVQQLWLRNNDRLIIIVIVKHD
jgi:hypothetical protein